MKRLYIPIFMVFGLLFLSCKQEIFQRAEQNPAYFTKLVRIADLVHLYELDSEKPFAPSLYIEATVNGVDDRSVHIQDNSDFALRVFVNNSADFKVGDLVRVIVGGDKLLVENAHFVVRNPVEITSVGNGFGTVAPVTLAELAADISKFTSKVVNVSELSFTEKQQRESITAYLVEQDIASGLNFWINIPDELEYDMPMSVSSARGYVSYESGNVYINVRFIDDIQEVYVEPTMMEKVLNNSSLVVSVLQSSENEIAPGVKMSEMSYMNNASPNNLLTSCTVFEVDLNNPKVRLEGGSPNEAGPPYTILQSLTVMAGHKNSSLAGTGWGVLAAITGDLHVAVSGQPSVVQGPIVRKGQILKTDFYNPAHYFLGILKNGGGVMIGGLTEFNQVKDNLDQAVGGVVLLRNGEPVSGLTVTRDARAAIGYSTNNKVYLFVGNGRYTSVGNGYSRQEIAEFLKALGCEGGLYVMEGGASAGILEDTASGVYNVFSRTHATNTSHNPPLASAWMIVTERD